MQILLIGAGTAAARLNVQLTAQGHAVVAQIASFSTAHLDLFDCRAIIVVAPEATAQTDSLIKASEHGKAIFVIAGGKDGLAAWANGVGIPAFAYPPSDVDIANLLEELRRVEAGNTSQDDQYRRVQLGSDMAARIQSGMVVRKIAVTSPKGGTGKTTMAVNLAVTLALNGVTTYLVDADANAGALQYHLRLDELNKTLVMLLREQSATPNLGVLGAIASGAAYLSAFTPIEGLPTLKVLPGFVTDDLADETLQDEERVAGVLQGVCEAGVAAGGVVVMDVGINPAHVLHRAALNLAEGIAIVIKPEIPDLAETRRWIARMIQTLSPRIGREGAQTFIGSRVKLCYNQVVGDGFKSAHKLLQDTLQKDGCNISLAPNGIIPMVDPHYAVQAVNSDHREDILVWRYKREHRQELAAFTEAVVGFAAHFVPAVQEGSSRIGLLGRPKEKRRGMFG